MMNQDILNQMSGNQPQDNNSHETERIIFGAIEDFIILSMLIWIVKKMFRHPMPALVFMIFTALAVWSALVITHDDWYFYPLAAIALGAMGRVIR